MRALLDGDCVDAQPQDLRAYGRRSLNPYPGDNPILQLTVFERGRKLLHSLLKRVEIGPELQFIFGWQRQLDHTRGLKHVAARGRHERLVFGFAVVTQKTIRRVGKRVLEQRIGFGICRTAGREMLARVIHRRHDAERYCLAREPLADVVKACSLIGRPLQ